MSLHNLKLESIKKTFKDFNTEINSKIEDLEKFLSSLQLSIPTEKPQKEPIKDWTLDSDGTVVIATDGSARTIDGVHRASYAVAYGPIGHPLNLACPIYGVATIFMAEVKAVTRALQETHVHGHKSINILIDSASAKSFAEQVIMCSDSSSVVTILCNVHPEMKSIVRQMCEAKKHYDTIVMTKIRSHTGQTGHLYDLNTAADILATGVLDATFGAYQIPVRVTDVSTITVPITDRIVQLSQLS